jgi:hypothetical protein
VRCGCAELKLRHKHKAAHPNIDPSSVPSLHLSLHTLNVQTHTRFKLKIEIELEPEPMELPECKAGSAFGQCKTGSRKKERTRSSKMCGQVCAAVASRKSQLCVQRHWCQPDQTRRWARRAETCAEQLKARNARTRPVGSSMVLRRQARCGPV